MGMVAGIPTVMARCGCREWEIAEPSVSAPRTCGLCGEYPEVIGETP